MKIVNTKINSMPSKTTSKGRRNNIVLQKNSGFSLIEVIVAALILSTSILGIASLQIMGMKGTQQSTMKTQAMGVIQNLTERMRANYQGVITGKYVLNDSNAFDCVAAAPVCTAACTAEKIATVDIHNLVCGYGNNPKTGGIRAIKSGDMSVLVNGTLTVACNLGDCTSGEVAITVGWSETAYGNETVAIASDNMVLRTRIAAP